MMGLVKYCLVWCSVLGLAFSVTPRAFRNLNEKVNILKRTFQRQLDSQKLEIDDLRFEVLDLKAELELERARTGKQLNSTELGGTTDENETTDNYEREDTKKTSTALENGILHQRAEEIQDLEKSIASNRLDIVKNKNALSIVQGMQHTICSTLQRAFIDEKNHNKKIKKQLMKVQEEYKDESLALVAEIKNQTEMLSGRTENNIDTIAMLQHGIQDQERAFNEMLNEITQQSSVISSVSGDLRKVTKNLTIADALIAENRWNITSLQASVENGVKSTLDIAKELKCLEDIRAGGWAMAKLIYKGLTVKRGKDWPPGINEELNKRTF